MAASEALRRLPQVQAAASPDRFRRSPWRRLEAPPRAFGGLQRPRQTRIFLNSNPTSPVTAKKDWKYQHLGSKVGTTFLAPNAREYASALVNQGPIVAR